MTDPMPAPVQKTRPPAGDQNNTITKVLFTKPIHYSKFLSGLRMRSYQQGVFEAVLDSVMNKLGFSFVVMFPRQSGKNELQAHLEVYLLTLLSQYPIELIKVSPTQKPQAQTSMRRFEKVARRNMLACRLWKKDGGNSYRLGQSRISFLSAAPGSNIVGATASGLLEVDEAQQVNVEKFDRDIAPMAASTFATHVFWGTAWTSTTLLGRELRSAQAAEKKDGRRRVFRLTADEVSVEVEAYRRHVEEKIARMGRSHPMVRTQYFSEEVDGAGGMFPPERMAKMGRSTRFVVNPAGMHALLLDVAGEDEGVRGLDGSMGLKNPARDATALTLVEVVLDGEQPKIGQGTIQGHGTPCPYMEKRMPEYHVLQRWQWIGANHAALQTQIRDIALEWKARALVVDATGVGAGLASFLERALPGRVTPFTFNSTSKSKLGWDFIAIVDSCRWQEPVFEKLPGDNQARYQKEFFDQLAACQFEVSNNPGRTMRWCVPDTARHAESGEPLHDDWVLSAALCAVLEKMDWYLPAAPLLIQGVDPLHDMDKSF